MGLPTTEILKERTGYVDQVRLYPSNIFLVLFDEIWYLTFLDFFIFSVSWLVLSQVLLPRASQPEQSSKHQRFHGWRGTSASNPTPTTPTPPPTPPNTNPNPNPNPSTTPTPTHTPTFAPSLSFILTEGSQNKKSAKLWSLTFIVGVGGNLKPNLYSDFHFLINFVSHVHCPSPNLWRNCILE